MLKHSLIILGLLFVSSPLYATTFSWVDENGVTHFSQTRPASGSYNILDKHPGYPLSEQPDAEPSAPAASSTPSSKDSKPKPSASAGLQKASKDQCQNVEADLNTLKITPRISIETSDGVKVLTEEEKQAMIDERVDWLKRYCE